MTGTDNSIQHNKKEENSAVFPLVSVIIPVYNSELYLAETLDSVLSSTYPNVEVIVMDDGSRDKSGEIATNYALKDKRIQVYTQPNGGASSARNNAIRLAGGKYILPVDGDDTISANYIEEAVNVLENNPEVKVVSREATYFGEKSGRWKFPSFSYNLLARRNIIDVCSMYRKSDWEKAGGYCEEIPGREDWDFWLSLFKSGGKFVRLPLVGLNYRIHSGSKRVRTRGLKKELIDTLNLRHKAFFYAQLNGKLHYQRTHSRKMNNFRHFFLPENIFVNPAFDEYEDAVYLANEKPGVRSEMLRKMRIPAANSIRFTGFIEKKYLLPGRKIATSQARKLYEQHSAEKNSRYLGYYEQQTSPCTLKSYLITLD